MSRGEIVPQLQGPATGWKGHINRYAGYTRAAKSMAAMHHECQQLGVSFILGEAGYAVKLLYKQEPDGQKVHDGVRTADSKVHKANVTMLALGAHAATILPSYADQVEAKSWAVGHARLTPEEADAMKDDDTNLLKIASNCAGYVNYVDSGNGQNISVPLTTTTDVPKADQERMRSLLRETFPALAERPLVHKFICWCADTMDSEYVIDWVPGFSLDSHSSLMMIGGDSGHAFKLLPVVGKWAIEMLGTGAQIKDRWKWKIYKRGGSTDVSWRVVTVQDIQESLGQSRLSKL
ncbi:hypothetical protein KEM56_004535 [Ascosphaera pollenicola]|nr:hypothetical protein KEM56_004535 [Ascosphaera pollenicola]